MDLAPTPEQEAARGLARLVVERAVGPGAVRKAEPLGHSPEVWRRLVEAGIPGMGSPGSAGGGDADLTVLVAAVRELGAAMTPAPVVEHLVAARALAAGPGHPALGDVVAGDLIAAFAPRPAVDGTARLVPGGAVADVVVGLDGDRLVAVRSPAPGTAPANHGSAPLADRDLRSGDVVVLADGRAAAGAYQRAGDEWRTLTAAALAGLAAAALDLALAYVKERRQFGVPVGSFQAVQHGLADLPGMVDGAGLLADEAAWALTTGATAATGATGHQLASMAFLFAGEAAREATARCVQYHGGYGYAEEGDAQLLHRRARGWALTLGDPGAELHRLADLVVPEG